MKPFIAGIYALFLFAMASGVYIAYRYAEGLVDNDYYRKGNGWFQAKTAEKMLGLEVGCPASMSLGSNELKFRLTEHGKPLRMADVRLFVGNVSDRSHDFSCPMRETSPGVYQAMAVVPFRGKWLVRMDLAAAQLKTTRSWFFDIR
jgi:hypothetical protein